MTARKPRETNPLIHRARIESLVIYEISEQELMLLERGSSEAVYLNFALGLLPTSLSFLIALLATEIESTKIYIVFVVVAIVTGISGLVLLALWWQCHQSARDLFRVIRDRLRIGEPLVAESSSPPESIDPPGS